MSASINSDGSITGTSLNLNSIGNVTGIQTGTFIGTGVETNPVTVNFTNTFSNIPYVVCTVIYNGEGYASGNVFISNITTTSFECAFTFYGSTYGENDIKYIGVNWIAISS